MTQEEVMTMLTDMGLHEGGMDNWVTDNAWVKFANRVAAKEREACAMTAENTSVYDRYSPEDTIADAIRARGQA
jgi:hypothetical protein